MMPLLSTERRIRTCVSDCVVLFMPDSRPLNTVLPRLVLFIARSPYSGTIVAALFTTTDVPLLAINEANCACISAVAAGEAAGLSNELWDAGGTNRPASDRPPAQERLLE